MDFYNFLLPSILMGGGIAIDVTIATLALFMMAGLSVTNWTLPITFTHIAFPAVGYYIFWGLAQTIPILTAVLGAAGFIFVALFVYEVVCESTGRKPIFGISAAFGSLVGLSEGDSRLIIRILAVSWDALWSGFAKAAQAAAGAWTPNEVIWSFLIAGLVVAIIAQLALGVAYLLRKIKFHSPKMMARWFMFGKWLELSVIGGFGVLSLWHGFTQTGNLYTSIAIAGVFMLVVFIILSSSFYENEYEEAVGAMEAS